MLITTLEKISFPLCQYFPFFANQINPPSLSLSTFPSVLNKYFIKIKIGSDCYTKVNMTFEEVPDIVPMKVDTFNAMTKENNRILPAWKRLSSVQICAL